MTQSDKAGTKYWDDNWSNVEFPQPFNHTDQSLPNYVNLELHRYFKNLLGEKRGFSVLEIGCANSIWPMYFYQYFGAQVYGLDYSEVGCEKSRDFLKHHHIPGEIYCADLFSPPSHLIQKFDLVVSFGVVEHFENTANCLKACSNFLKPGGMLLTLIPNIPSIIGFIQKYVDRTIYDIHVPLTKKMFLLAHADAELSLEASDYLMSINLSVVHSGAFSSHPFNPFFRRMLWLPTKICWLLEKYGIKIPKNRFSSPYVIAVARKR